MNTWYRRLVYHEILQFRIVMIWNGWYDVLYFSYRACSRPRGPVGCLLLSPHDDRWYINNFILVAFSLSSRLFLNTQNGETTRIREPQLWLSLPCHAFMDDFVSSSLSTASFATCVMSNYRSNFKVKLHVFKQIRLTRVNAEIAWRIPEDMSGWTE